MGLHARRYVSCKLAYDRVKGAIALTLMLIAVTPQEVSAGQARGKVSSESCCLVRGPVGDPSALFRRPREALMNGIARVCCGISCCSIETH
jgi:hypothetical protein